MQAKNIFLLLILISIVDVLYSQDPIDSTMFRQKNEIYVSLLGEASIYSINYEKIFINDENVFTGAKIGIGYNESIELCLFGPCNSKQEYFITVPHGISINYGSEKNYFELGLDGVLLINDSRKDYLPFISIGYRYQPKVKNKLMFKIFANIPTTSGNSKENIWIIPAGIALGCGF